MTDTTRVASVMELLVALPLEHGTWGETAVEFQVADATAVIDPNGTGPRFHFCTRPRGGRKSTDAAAIAVALHVNTPAPLAARSYVVAADAQQAGLVLDSVRQFVMRAPLLKKRIKIETRRVLFTSPKGEPLSSVEVLPADEASSWGLRPWLLIADELANWPQTAGAKGLWASVASSLVKDPASRLLVITSAGPPDHFAYEVLEHARTSPQWHVSEVPGPLPWVTEEQLAEQRALLPEFAYRRLHLNQWTQGSDRLTSPEEVRRCVKHVGILAPRRRVSYRHGLDIGLVSDASVLTTAHREHRDGVDVIVVDAVTVWQGSRKHPVDLQVVEDQVLETIRAYGGKLIFDPYQAVGMGQRLRSKGIRVEPFAFTSTSVGRIALSLLRALRSEALDLPDDPDLIRELSSVVLRENQPGSYRIDHDPDKHDDRVISLGLIVQELASTWTGTTRLAVAVGRIPTRRGELAPKTGPLPIVREGEPRPIDRLQSFRNARRHPNYQPPGRR